MGYFFNITLPFHEGSSPTVAYCQQGRVRRSDCANLYALLLHDEALKGTTMPINNILASQLMRKKKLPGSVRTAGATPSIGNCERVQNASRAPSELVLSITTMMPPRSSSIQAFAKCCFEFVSAGRRIVKKAQRNDVHKWKCQTKSVKLQGTKGKSSAKNRESWDSQSC